ncbi:MAG: MMPL family transporter [Acidimicrobiia bacterium]|nr:MMPL family transporter [Acidimicrobiia bacterium]
MSRAMFRLGHFAATHKWRVIAVWIAAFVLAAIGVNSFGGETSDNFTLPGTETQRALDLLKERFPAESGDSARVVFATEDGSLSDPNAAAGIDGAVVALSELPHVVDVISPVDEQTSPDGTIGFATVTYDQAATELGTEALDGLEEAVVPAVDAGLQVEFGGDVVQFNEEGEFGGAELIGLGVAIIVLLFAFGSVVAMGLPLVTALIGLGLGLSVVTISANFLDIGTVAPVIATMIGLGVGIDYALFVVTRHREHLHQGMTVAEAAARANATAGQAVVFAGVTVVIAILGLQFIGIPFVATLGSAAAIVVGAAVLTAITLLPALLGLVGHKIDKLRVPGMKAVAADSHDGFWARWSRRVSGRPWPYLIGSAALLLLLLVPFFSMRLGVTDAGTSPPSTTLRQSYDLLAEGFGSGFNGPLQVVVDLDDTGREGLTALETAVEEDEGIAQIGQTRLNSENPAEADTALIVAFPTTSPQDAATADTVHRLRDEVLPTAIGDDATVYVAGTPAVFIDFSEKLAGRLPLFIGAVLVMSFLLLMLVFRSLFVPLKAAVVNLLGIGAAYGVVVAIFQWGWGRDLIGLEETVPIVSFLPMLMFAILFGLSMDYEVFLMSRIREEYLKTGDNNASVAAGIAGTARVITAAAIIMISVFGSFALGDQVEVKMMGIGLATAILLDATIIRMVLVPSVMALVGDANWWLPKWLDRILPNLDIEGETALPEPEYEDGRGPNVPPPELVGAGSAPPA